jgi:hypothetical protein
MPIMDTLSDQLRRYMTEAAEVSSLRQVSRDAGIDVGTLSRFISGAGGLSVEGLDRLGKALGLQLRRIRPARAKKGR